MTVTPENPAWGILEWVLTGLATFVGGAIAFVWRFMTRMETMKMAIRQQQRDFDASKSSIDAALLRLTERLTQLHEDYYRLRETIVALPTRGDMRELESRLGERLDSLAARFDRAFDSQHGA